MPRSKKKKQGLKKQKKTKKTQKSKKKSFGFFRLFTVFFLCLFLFFIFDSYLLGGQKIKRKVYLGQDDISSLSQAEFNEYVKKYRKNIFSKKIFLRVDETEIIVLPHHLGLDLDGSKMWKSAYAVGREPKITSRFKSWLGSFYKPRHISPESFVNKKVLNQNILAWEREANLKKTFEGSVEIKGVEVITRLPENGKRIDEKILTTDLVHAFLEQKSEHRIAAQIKDRSHLRSTAEILEFSERVKHFISKPLILANTKFEDVSLNFSIHDIVDVVKISIPKNPLMSPRISIDDLAFSKKMLVLQVRNADFKVNEDYSVDVTPGRNGVDVNLEKTKKNLFETAMSQKKGIVHIAINDLIVPDFSDNDANRLGVYHVVSEFTTHHPCCTSRVDNIQKVADLLDGVILYPGEELNLNTFLGERTKEKGFKGAGTIIKGEMVDTVGGGISQFVTTLHNAVYWGGYAIIKHKPHSIYFLRYPHGIEATINWPHVDYIFKNDTENAIIIDTEYTKTSITVRILGDNDGRIVSGDHRSWETPMKIIKKGGEKSRRVVSKVADAHSFRPPVVRYISDFKIPRGSSRFIKKGRKGWKTVVNREIYVDNQLRNQNVWPVYYQSGKDSLYKVHPCDNPQEKKKPKKC